MPRAVRSIRRHESDSVAELEGPGPLPDGPAHVWWARRQDASARHPELLDETERQRWAAYRRDEDRERFLAGCALAKTALAGDTAHDPPATPSDLTPHHPPPPPPHPSTTGPPLS